MKKLIIFLICLTTFVNAKMLTYTYQTQKCPKIIKGGYCDSHSFIVKYKPEKGRLSVGIGVVSDSLITIDVDAYDKDSMWIRTIKEAAELGHEYYSTDSSTMLFSENDAKEIKYISIRFNDEKVKYKYDVKCYHKHNVPWKINDNTIQCAPIDTMFKNTIMEIDIDGKDTTYEILSYKDFNKNFAKLLSHTKRIIFIEDVSSIKTEFTCEEGYFVDTTIIYPELPIMCNAKVPEGAVVTSDGKGYYFENIEDENKDENIEDDTIDNARIKYCEEQKRKHLTFGTPIQAFCEELVK